MFERTPEMRDLIRRLRSVTPKVGSAKRGMKIKETRPVNPDGDEAANVIMMLERKIEDQEAYLDELHDMVEESAAEIGRLQPRELELLRLVERLSLENLSMRKAEETGW